MTDSHSDNKKVLPDNLKSKPKPRCKTSNIDEQKEVLKRTSDEEAMFVSKQYIEISAKNKKPSDTVEKDRIRGNISKDPKYKKFNQENIPVKKTSSSDQETSEFDKRKDKFDHQRELSPMGKRKTSPSRKFSDKVSNVTDEKVKRKDTPTVQTFKTHLLPSESTPKIGISSENRGTKSPLKRDDSPDFISSKKRPVPPEVPSKYSSPLKCPDLIRKQERIYKSSSDEETVMLKKSKDFKISKFNALRNKFTDSETPTKQESQPKALDDSLGIRKSRVINKEPESLTPGVKPSNDTVIQLGKREQKPRIELSDDSLTKKKQKVTSEEPKKSLIIDQISPNKGKDSRVKKPVDLDTKEKSKVSGFESEDKRSKVRGENVNESLSNQLITKTIKKYVVTSEESESATDQSETEKSMKKLRKPMTEQSIKEPDYSTLKRKPKVRSNVPEQVDSEAKVKPRVSSYVPEDKRTKILS
ncbi:unnamed protein product [Rotaria magnacalcarata]|uniref:Uncharacterized protein n=1 Tax=Rotaria magnacalcarata TaxID=392030 RepID=A0A819ZA05_9BILA|nr:unnamed protein product [Rotaria magnacalcarata]CAF4167598.1 unnamed protein product [Rotaria magnacalcarata]